MISKFVIYCNTIFSNNIKKASILKYSILCFMVGLKLPIQIFIIYNDK